MRPSRPTFTMKPISTFLHRVPEQVWDHVIVGSGYGGSIAASRLARAGRKVLLLERGREILPGDYPRDMASAQSELEVITARDGNLSAQGNGARGGRNGMMQLRVNADVHVVLGNGLGGGSLVNAGVSIQPDMRVFQSGWPLAYAPRPDRDRTGPDGAPVMHNTLTHHFEITRRHLGARQVPNPDSLPKFAALKQSAKVMGQKFTPADINVTFEKGPNAFGFEQAACTLCGDCCSGCNYGAKNSLIMNYLPDAVSHGAIIATEAEVATVLVEGSGFVVHAKDLSGAEHRTVRIVTKGVILAAGALGSTEILFRSYRAGLPLSYDALGRKFSANGDVLGFGFGANVPGSSGLKSPATPLYSIGAGTNPPNEPKYRPGPTITGIIRVDMDNGAPLQNGLVIEDGAAPGPFAKLYPAALFLQEAVTANVVAAPDAAQRLAGLKALGEGLQSGADAASLSYSGIMAQMQSYLLMSHDAACGRLISNLETGYVTVEWADAGLNAPYKRDNDKLAEAAQAIWADYIPNPIWQPGFGNNVVTVHPLGGCAMADTEAEGVTDADCRVYRGDGSNGVYPQLLVCDGAVIPTALGVNPLLTISAIANRAMDQLLNETEAPDPKPVVQLPPPLTGLVTDPQPESWNEIAAEIAHAADGALLVEAATLLGRTATEIALNEVLSKVFPKNWSRSWNEPVSQFVHAAKLEDLRAGFKVLHRDLSALAAALRRSGPEGGMQGFMNEFIKLAGDVAPALAFTETMSGFVSGRRERKAPRISNPYEVAAALGKAEGHDMKAAFSIAARSPLGWDGEGNVTSQIVGAALTGTVTLTGADGVAHIHDVLEGRFDLLQPLTSRVETWTMAYRCKLQARGAESPAWSMSGTKYLQRRDGSSYARDLTSLYVDLNKLGAPEGRSDLQGIIRLDLQAIAAQLPTITQEYDTSVSIPDWVAALMTAARDGAFSDRLGDGTLLHGAFRAILAARDDFADDTWAASLGDGLKDFFRMGVAELFGTLILRSYGGFLSYMQDFPSDSDGKLQALPIPGTRIEGVPYCTEHALPNREAPKVKLYHFAPPNPHLPVKGPVLLAPGMSTTALSFACLTNDGHSLVRQLLDENYDIWAFDSRVSPRVTPINTDYTLDDVAAEDWPMAVDFVLAHTTVPARPEGPSMQIVAHCIGALTVQMALLSGAVKPGQVRQLVLMQFTALPAANWFNVVKSELGVAQDFSGGFRGILPGLIKSQLEDDPQAWKVIAPILEHGTPTICPVSASPRSADYQVPLDEIHNLIDWHAPFGIDHVCMSPTCHRIYGLYGPVIAHKNLNEDTHNAMRQIFGEIAIKPFEHLGLILQRGRAVTAEGKDDYMHGFARLRMPIHIISGDLNQIILPESGYFMQKWLQDKMPESRDLFTWKMVSGYAHNDCVIGKRAHVDIFPDILRHLNREYDG